MTSVYRPRDYLVDYTVRLVGMAPYMANQSSIGIAWSNTSYRNERGFKNENMYTTVAYRVPGEGSIDDLSMSEGAKEEKISSPQEDRSSRVVLLVGAHRPRRFPLRRRGVRYRIARFGAYHSFSATDGVPYGPDRTVRLLVLLRSQQVCR